MEKILEGQYVCPTDTKSNLQELNLRQKTKHQLTPIILKTVLYINMTIIILVIFSLFIKTTPKDIIDLVNEIPTKNAITITLTSISISLICILGIGIPMAYVLHKNKGPIYRIIELICSIPLLLPPSVIGIALLMAFGRRGIIGPYFEKFNISIPFTYIAVIIAQIFVTMPIFIQIVKNGFKLVNPIIEEAAKIGGAGERQLLALIYIPLSKSSIIAGLSMCALRAAGEFGATIMFAGNLEGKTQTMTTYIYSLYQKDMNLTVTAAVIQILIIVIPTLLFIIFSRKEF